MYQRTKLHVASSVEVMASLNVTCAICGAERLPRETYRRWEGLKRGGRATELFRLDLVVPPLMQSVFDSPASIVGSVSTLDFQAFSKAVSF